MRPLTAISITVSAIVLVIVSAVMMEPVSSGTFPGTNGKIIFASDRDGNKEIYVMDADGSNQTRLTTNSSLDVEPSWSPNGSKIAFNSDRDGNKEIYVMNADGSNATRLTNNSTREYYPS